MLKASRREHCMRAGAVLPACRIALVGALTLALVLPGVGILTGSAASAAAVVSADPPHRIPPKPTVKRPTAAEASRRSNAQRAVQAAAVAQRNNGSPSGSGGSASKPVAPPPPPPAPIYARASFSPLTGTRLTLANSANANFQATTDAQLAQRYTDCKAERRLYVRSYDRDLQAAFEQAIATNDAARKVVVERALRAALGDLVTKSPMALAGMITTRGSADQINFDARDAALHFAMLYRVTGDKAHADRAAAILHRFARLMPRWPIWNPYYGAQVSKTNRSQADPATFQSEYSAGLWGSWIYMDLVMGTPLVQAYAYIQPANSTKALGADAEINAMLDLHVATQRKYNPGPDFSNMDAFRIRGMMEFGRYRLQPELVHEAVRHLENMYRVGFYPDGWWHEASSSYHLDLQNGLRSIATEMLKGYSDPVGFRSAVDGTRYDNLDLAARLQKQIDRADNALRKATLPDMTLLATNETQWPERAPAGFVPQISPYLFGSTGLAGVAGGVGDAFALVTLQWGGSGSHAHFDALNLGIFAKGTEAMSLGQYRPLDGSGSTREWHQSTAAHATVVVDGQNQGPTGRFGSRRRTPTADDAIQGVPDWRWRWGRAANDSGSLRLFNVEFNNVQVMEAEAAASYDMITGVTRYQRTVALVRIDAIDSYIVDIFRVRGGNVHDYMLHGSLQLPHAVNLSLPLASMAGTLHGSISNLRGAAADGDVVATFSMPNDVKLTTFVAGVRGSHVIQGDAPAMRRAGTAPFVMVRRTGGDSVFVAVHHVYDGLNPKVLGLELLPTDSPECVAFKVTTPNRVDTIVSNADRANTYTVGDGIEVRALFAHMANSPQTSNNWDYMVDGDLLRTPRSVIDGEVSFAGSVADTRSAEAGEGPNGLVLGAPIPAGTPLAGLPIIVDLAGQMTWAFRITGIGRSGRAPEVLIGNEPGFDIRRGVVKQTCFPNWGFPGSATYRIPGTALMQPAAAGAWSLTQTGTAVGSLVAGGASPGQ